MGKLRFFSATFSFHQKSKKQKLLKNMVENVCSGTFPKNETLVSGSSLIYRKSSYFKIIEQKNIIYNWLKFNIGVAVRWDIDVAL